MASKAPKKWQPNAMVAKCKICDSPADHVKHFGATACYSCRAFFQRTIKNRKEYKSCVRNNDACSVDAVTRTNCKKCRYQKCLLVGMQAGKLRENITQEEELGQEQNRNITERSEGNSNVIEVAQLQLETESEHTSLQKKVVDIDSLEKSVFQKTLFRFISRQRM